MPNKKPVEVIGGDSASTRFGVRQDFAFDRSDPLTNVTHSDLLKDAFPGRSQPVITDPSDGMPRPDDDRPVSNILPFSVDTFVCIEDERQWVELFKEDDFAWPSDRNLGRVKRRSRFDCNGDEYEPWFFQKSDIEKHFGVDVARKDGRVIPVQPIRPRCTHYSEQLAVADDVDGVPVYRFCAAYRTLAGAHWSLFDESILACTSRNPRDFLSEKQLVKRNRNKMEQGRNQHMVELIAPETDHELERVKKIVDGAGSEAIEFDIEPEPGIPSTMKGRLILLSPSALARQGFMGKPDMVVLPEKEFQPSDVWFEHKAYDQAASLEEGAGEFMRSGSGDQIARIPIDSPEYTSDEDADTWPAFNKNRNPLLPMQILKNAQAAALALRKGKTIHVIGETVAERPAFFAALALYFVGKACGDPMSGLECLEGVEKEVGRECATNFTHRVYLRRLGP